MPKCKEGGKKTLLIGSLLIYISSGLHLYFFPGIIRLLPFICQQWHVPATEWTMRSASSDYFHLVFILHSLPSHNFLKNVIVINFSFNDSCKLWNCCDTARGVMNYQKNQGRCYLLFLLWAQVLFYRAFLCVFPASDTCLFPSGPQTAHLGAGVCPCE